MADKKFDDGKDVTAELEISKARRPLLDQKRVNVDFSTWVVASPDKEASHPGMTRRSIIKIWLDERIEQSTSG